MPKLCYLQITYHVNENSLYPGNKLKFENSIHVFIITVLSPQITSCFYLQFFSLTNLKNRDIFFYSVIVSLTPIRQVWFHFEVSMLSELHRLRSWPLRT